MRTFDCDQCEICFKALRDAEDVICDECCDCYRDVLSYRFSPEGMS